MNQPLSYQPAIVFDLAEGKMLAETGMNLAVEMADKKHKDWGGRCWNLFTRWINKKPVGFEFMIEDFRNDCYKYNMIERPRSERAFGFISGKALRRGLVRFSRTANVKNVKAHATPASVWMKL